MQEFLKILKRFIPPYKTNLVLTFLYHFLSCVCRFSVGLMIPILEILFGMAEDVNTQVPGHSVPIRLPTTSIII